MPDPWNESSEIAGPCRGRREGSYACPAVPLPAPEPDQSFPEELSAHPEQFETYKRLVHDELSDLRPIDIASVVSADYVFDFTILYESLVESRALYPFRLHAYALDDEAHSRLAEAGLAGVEYVDAPWSSWFVDIPGSRPSAS